MSVIHEIQEETTAWLLVSFRGRDGNLEVPTDGTYEIVDLKSGTVVRAATGLEYGSQPEITLEPADNVILDDTRAYETRRVIIKANFGLDGHINETFDYHVKNLIRVPEVGN